jgi:hypothetical protein
MGLFPSKIVDSSALSRPPYHRRTREISARELSIFTDCVADAAVLSSSESSLENEMSASSLIAAISRRLVVSVYWANSEM